MRILIVGANNSGIRSLIMNRLEGKCDVIEFLGDNVEIDDIEDHYIPAVLSDAKEIMRAQSPYLCSSRGKGAKRERKLSRGW